MGHKRSFDGTPVGTVVGNSLGISGSAETQADRPFPYVPRRGTRGKGGGFPAPRRESDGREYVGTNSPNGRPVGTALGKTARFAGWLAGASAEQQARWERMQAGLAADPVKDEQLPPALRGGSLEVF